MHLPSWSWTGAFTQMNQNAVNIFFTDMINISIESFELLQNKIINMQNIFHYNP